MEVFIESENVKYSEDFIESKYDYQFTTAERIGNKITVIPKTETLVFRTQRKVPRVGVMLVGWGGNNGSTFTAALIANKMGFSWPTKRGTQEANWFGSITQSSTCQLGSNLHVPMGQLLPTINPNEILVDGWDISNYNLAEAMKRAQVFEPSLQEMLKPHMEKYKPRASIYVPDFIAANQSSRANNILEGNKEKQVQQICRDIEEFKTKEKLDKIIVLWTANTERFVDIIPGLNDTAENLKLAISNDHPEISPSTLFAYASICMGCPYLNGSPQNTFVPGLIEFAEEKNVYIAGDDFKSGQTKIKSVIVDFLVSAGIKPVSIVSYNHLGNNDGKNLSAPQQFKSKEISKSNVVNDIVKSNNILYKPGEKPDHVVVIKYAPYVGDSKRAMDEYISEIMMGGQNILSIYNVCEDSLLATPIMLDLVILTELFSRMKVRKFGQSDEEFTGLHAVLSVLSYLLKAPLVPNDTPIVNPLFKQRACIENLMRACVGLNPENNMLLEYKVPIMMEDAKKKLN